MELLNETHNKSNPVAWQLSPNIAQTEDLLISGDQISAPVPFNAKSISTHTNAALASSARHIPKKTRLAIPSCIGASFVSLAVHRQTPKISA